MRVPGHFDNATKSACGVFEITRSAFIHAGRGVCGVFKCNRQRLGEGAGGHEIAARAFIGAYRLALAIGFDSSQKPRSKLDVEGKSSWTCVGKIDGRKGAVIQQETMSFSLFIDSVAAEEPYDLAVIVDAEGLSLRGARNIDRGEGASGVPHKAMDGSCGVGEIAHNSSAVVDVCSDCRRAAGSVNGGEDTIVHQEPVGYAPGIRVLAHDPIKLPRIHHGCAMTS